MANEGIEYEIYPFNDVKASKPKWILPGRLNPTFLEEIGGAGGGTFSIPLNDPKYSADPTMLEARNVCRVKVDGNYVGGFLIGHRESTLVDSGERKTQGISITGVGLKSWFDDADVHPYLGLSKNPYASNRHFNFAAERGDWYIANDWKVPNILGTIFSTSLGWHDPARGWTSDKKPAPTDWPTLGKTAKWIWGVPYNVNGMPVGTCYFRQEVNITVAGIHALYVAVDDEFVIYVDGEEVAKSSDTSWTKTTRIELNLGVGLHTIAYKAWNWPLETDATQGRGPAGLVSTLTRVGADNKETLIDTSGSANWRVLPYPTVVPGWTLGEVMNKLLNEASARGVLFPTYLTRTFTNSTDSYGAPWPEKIAWAFSVGQSYSEVLSSFEEFYDIWIDPDLKLNIVPNRGVVRTQPVVEGNTVKVKPIEFMMGKHLRSAHTTTHGKITNFLSVKTEEGWKEVKDDASIMKYGRIEGSMEVNADETMARRLGAIVLSKRATEEIGATYDLIPDPWKPFVDFGVGDWVLAPSNSGIKTPRRVMSISVEESDSGRPQYTIEFDTIFQDNETRINKTLAKLGGGGVSGGSGSAGGITPGGGGGGIVLPPTYTPPAIRPKTPTGLRATSSGYWSANGVLALSQVTVNWDAVTQDANNDALVPIGYDLYGRAASTPDGGWTLLGRYTSTSAVLTNFTPGMAWSFQVVTIGDGDIESIPSAAVNHTPVGPTAPMLAPTAPTLTTDLGVIYANWNGLLSNNQAPPPQFRYVYAEVANASTGPWVRKGFSLNRAGTIQITGEPIGATRWVRLIAVDGAEIASPASPSASKAVLGVDFSEMSDEVMQELDLVLGVAEGAQATATAAQTAATAAQNAATAAGNNATAAQRAADAAAATVSALLESAENRVLDPSMSGGQWTKTEGGWKLDTTTGRTDSFSLRTDTASGATNVVRNPDGTPMLIPVTPGEVWELSAWVKTTPDWNGSANNSKLRLIDQTGTMRGAAAISAPIENWKYVSLRYIVPATGVSALRYTVVSDNTVGSAWWDDFSFKNVTAVVQAEKDFAAAQTLANNAKTAADNAKTAADNAASAAAAAATAAGKAQTTADGKNRIIPSVNEPSKTDPLLKVGDQWWRLQSGNTGNIIGVRVWNGSAWVNYLLVANSIVVPGSVTDTIISDNGITTPKIMAEAVVGSHVKAGTLETTHVSATFGSDLILESNNSVTTIITQQNNQSTQLASLEESTDNLATVAQNATNAASQTTARVNSLTGELQEVATTATDARNRVNNLQTWFRVDIEGAHVGAVGSAFQTHIKPDRFEITENNAVTTYWESGRMVVPSMETDEIVITNFKFEAYEAGMVVRLG